MTFPTGRILREGVVLGLIGAGSVALWFLVIDGMLRRPFFTPAVLGSAVFSGLRDPATVNITAQPILAYSAVHVLAFVVVGVIVAAVIAESRKTPHVLWLLAEFFIVFEVGFVGLVGLFFTPLLAELAWINIALGNLIAAAAMGYYVWRIHRRLGAHQGS